MFKEKIRDEMTELNRYDRLAQKIYFWTPEVQRSAAEIAKNHFGEY